MANNQYVNKVVLADGRTLINLENDTVTQADVLSGVTFHLPNGATVQGTCSYDADTSDADAAVGEILEGKTAYKNGQKLTGTMPNIGGQTGAIEEVDEEVSISAGYHDGSGKIGIKSTEQQKIIPGNIKSGVIILGVTGSYTGEAISARSANATPYFDAQTILPGDGYDYLSQVNIAAIAVVETDNQAGGKTVTIGTATPAAS